MLKTLALLLIPLMPLLAPATIATIDPAATWTADVWAYDGASGWNAPAILDNALPGRFLVATCDDAATIGASTPKKFRVIRILVLAIRSDLGDSGNVQSGAVDVRVVPQRAVVGIVKDDLVCERPAE